MLVNNITVRNDGQTYENPDLKKKQKQTNKDFPLQRLFEELHSP